MTGLDTELRFLKVTPGLVTTAYRSLFAVCLCRVLGEAEPAMIPMTEPPPLRRGGGGSRGGSATDLGTEAAEWTVVVLAGLAM